MSCLLCEKTMENCLECEEYQKQHAHYSCKDCNTEYHVCRGILTGFYMNQDGNYICYECGKLCKRNNMY
jgi:hypothetical protein